MAIIREHCQPGARRNPTGWLPQAAWPEDCVVQWGERGIVISNDRTRQTAFFELLHDPLEVNLLFLRKLPEVTYCLEKTENLVGRVSAATTL